MPMNEHYSRAQVVPLRGDLSARIDPTGGQFSAGMMAGISLITRGEAEGHGFWIDQDLLAALASALMEATAAGDGIKSRYTHPFASADSLGLFLGRITAVDARTTAAALAEGWIPCDLHVAKTAHRTPQGDLAGYVMERAVEDSGSLGVSAVFARDYAAEVDFMLAHGGEVSTGPDGVETITGFQSPDPDNVHNLPHARLSELRAADVVGDPAANPGGLNGPVAGLSASADVWRFAFGLTNTPPAVAALDVDPARLRDHVQSFLTNHNLTILERADEMPNPENQPKPEAVETPAAAEETPAEPVEEVNQEPEAVETPAAAEEAPAEPVAEGAEPITQDEPEASAEPEAPAAAEEAPAELVALSRGELEQWNRLGPNAMAWLSSGLSLQEATAKRLGELEQLAANNAEAARLSRGEAEPVSGNELEAPAEPVAMGRTEDGTAALAAELDAKIQSLRKPSPN